jgi:hypothetical protein
MAMHVDRSDLVWLRVDCCLGCRQPCGFGRDQAAGTGICLHALQWLQGMWRLLRCWLACCAVMVAALNTW